MQTQLQAAINQLCAEKNLEPDLVIETIENAISLAYKKDFGRLGQEIKVHLGDDISQMRIFEIRVVVKKVENHDTEITQKDAKVIRPDAQLEDTVFVPVELHAQFGRIAAQAARQVITQKLQEAEREMLFQKFKDKEGHLLSVRVQKVDKDCILLEIDGVSTILSWRDQIPGENYFTGQRLLVLLERVELTTKGPQLRITRATDRFISALFEQEIPEMKSGLVRVEKIAREPGVRCKIAVASDDTAVDPVGAFVGQKGVRINAVMDEVGEERLDVIQHFEDPKKMLLAALSPAKIARVEFYKGDKKEDRVKIYVREDERAITIGKKGQNVRLAGELLGMQVDVITYDGPPTEDEVAIETAATKAVAKKSKTKKAISEKVTIDHLEGVDKEVIQILKDMDLSQIKQFEGLKPEDLVDVGISLKDARAVMNAVQKFLGE